LMEWNYYLNSELNDSEKIRQQLAFNALHNLQVQGVKDVTFKDLFLNFSVKEEIEDEVDELEKARMQNKKIKQKFLKQMEGM